MSMRVYGFWRSLASFRVRVALKIKQIQFEEIPIDILRGEQFEHGYAAINAERVVPTLVHDDYSVFQSLAIMEYLDDIQPAPRLIPRDARDRAYARSLALVAVADAHPFLVSATISPRRLVRTLRQSKAGGSTGHRKGLRLTNAS